MGRPAEHVYREASARIECDGAHWIGTTQIAIEVTLADLVADGPIEVVLMHDDDLRFTKEVVTRVRNSGHIECASSNKYRLVDIYGIAF